MKTSIIPFRKRSTLDLLKKSISILVLALVTTILFGSVVKADGWRERKGERRYERHEGYRHERERDYDRGYRHCEPRYERECDSRDYCHPRVGHRFERLPRGCRRVYYEGRPYYYRDGVCYFERRGFFEVCISPIRITF